MIFPAPADKVAETKKTAGAPALTLVLMYRLLPWLPLAPPPRVMLPPLEDKVLPPLPRSMPRPAYEAPPELPNKEMLPPLVVMFLLAAMLMPPVLLSKIAAPELVLCKWVLTAMVLPYTVMGPLILVSAAVAKVMAVVLVLLPMVRLASEVPKAQPLVLKAPVKLVEAEADSTRKAPGPLKTLDEVVGALLANTKVPAAMLVAPV